MALKRRIKIEEFSDNSTFQIRPNIDDLNKDETETANSKELSKIINSYEPRSNTYQSFGRTIPDLVSEHIERPEVIVIITLIFSYALCFYKKFPPEKFSDWLNPIILALIICIAWFSTRFFSSKRQRTNKKSSYQKETK